MSPELPISSPSAIESRKRITPLVIYHKRSRRNYLVPGYDFQNGEWVIINNPIGGQPHKGEVIGVTRDRLLKIQGEAYINGKVIVTIIERSPKNLFLAN